MNKFLFPTILVFSFSLISAQSDSSVYYISDKGITTSKDSAESYTIIFWKEGRWYGKNINTKNGSIENEGNYLKNDIGSKSGTFKNYTENGKLNYTEEYNNGLLKEKTYLYNNGNKKSSITYIEGKVGLQKGWDDNGKEIKDYVAEKEATLKGGLNGWRRYLEKNLNANVAADAGAPAGMYTVNVEFVVSKEGIISNVKAVTIPKKCAPCAREAVSVIANGPDWEPAIQNNVTVAYRQSQTITFVVQEYETKKGKKN